MAVPILGHTRKKRVCIICEGFEEKEYLERLQSFGAWQERYYDVVLVNAKSISNIGPRYQDIYMNDNYDVVLVFCDTDTVPYDGYNSMKKKIDMVHGRSSVAAEIVFFANPCVLQIVLLHFADVRLQSNQKNKNNKYIEELVGIKHYQAHEEQRAALMEKITKQNYKEMLERVKELSDQDTVINSTNFLKLIGYLNSRSPKWIDQINKVLEG
jgi:hypothetical protein